MLRLCWNLLHLVTHIKIKCRGTLVGRVLPSWPLNCALTFEPVNLTFNSVHFYFRPQSISSTHYTLHKTVGIVLKKTSKTVFFIKTSWHAVNLKSNKKVGQI